MSIKTYVYLRVSTTEQTDKSQMVGITAWLEKNGITEINVRKESISGGKKWRERGLLAIMNEANQGDRLIVSELSRIGRSTADVLDFLSEASNIGLQVTAVKNNITFDSSISSKIFSTVLALAAEIERDFIRQRTKEGMQNAKNAGKTIGRPKGSTGKRKLDTEQQELERLLAAGVSKSAIARVMKVSRGTVARSIRRKQDKQ